MEGELADNVKIYMGTPQGFQFAKQYAAVLFKLGKFDEAVEAIEQQLQIELSEEIDRDELRLIGALIARNSARSSRYSAMSSKKPLRPVSPSTR